MQRSSIKIKIDSAVYQVNPETGFIWFFCGLFCESGETAIFCKIAKILKCCYCRVSKHVKGLFDDFDSFVDWHAYA